MIRVGDCLEVMRTLDAESVDAIVTDPPYHLTTGKKGGTGPASLNLESPYGRARIGTGFMGKAWDGGDIAHDPRTWAEALRVAKPGAYLVAFGGTRTFHRLACAIEDAGWELRDSILRMHEGGHSAEVALEDCPWLLGWTFGSGFPKSLNLDGDRAGWGTALKPAFEPIVLARKPFRATVAENVALHGTGALNIDASRIATDEDLKGGAYAAEPNRSSSQSLSPTGLNRPGARAADEFEQPAGRWPANVIHDGSEAVLSAFPIAPGQIATSSSSSRKTQNTFGAMKRGSGGMIPRIDSDESAARFFYCAKASREDRNDGTENTHPTVKPTDLMRWLCRLVTPPGGLVLDPFAGSGSTGRGAIAEGFQFLGIELDPKYAAIAEARIRAMQPGLSFGSAA